VRQAQSTNKRADNVPRNSRPPPAKAATRSIRRTPLQNAPVTEDPWTFYSPGDDVWLGREGDTR